MKTNRYAVHIFYSILFGVIQQFFILSSVEKNSRKRNRKLLFLSRYCMEETKRKIGEARYSIVHFAFYRTGEDTSYFYKRICT